MNFWFSSIGKLLKKRKVYEKLNLSKPNSPCNLFSGLKVVSLICSKCKSGKYYIEKFSELFLHLNNNKNFNQCIKELIKNHFKEEVIEEFYCEKCKKKQSILKWQSILNFPKILMIVVSRFSFDPYAKKLCHRIVL